MPAQHVAGGVIMQATLRAEAHPLRTAVSLLVSAALIVVIAWLAFAVMSGTIRPAAIDTAPYADYGARHAPVTQAYPDYGVRHRPAAEAYPDYGIRHAQ
jgi:hypothetical protein